MLNSPIGNARLGARWQEMTRREVLRAGAATTTLVAGGVAAACGQESASGPATLSKGPVTVRAFIGGIGAALIDRWEPEVAAPLKQRVPNLTLELLSQAAMTDGSTADVVQKFTAMLAGGDPPDVNDLPRPASQQVELGFLDEKIDAFIKRDKIDTKQFNQREFEQKTVYKGKMWQLPYKYLSNALVVVYNRQLFQAASVPFPDADPARTWDWDTHLQAMTKLTARGRRENHTLRHGARGIGHLHVAAHVPGGLRQPGRQDRGLRQPGDARGVQQVGRSDAPPQRRPTTRGGARAVRHVGRVAAVPNG